MEEQAASNPEGIVGLMLRLRGHGIVDPTLLKAVEAVPHNQFVPVEFHQFAWQNRSMPISCGQTMHSPDTVLRLVHAANIEPHHSVLHVGTGSGFLTGLLAKLAKKVHSVDRYKTLIEAARDRLTSLDINNVSFGQENGSDGSDKPALYDRIIIDSAYDTMPRALLDQLVSSGVVITAIGEPQTEQDVVRLTKIGSRFERENLFKVRFGALEKGVAEAL